MNNFGYTNVTSAEEAISTLERVKDSLLIAGGTDVVPLMKDDILQASALVDISKWKAGHSIRVEADGLHIGALASLGDIAAHEEVRRSYTALTQACEMAATPQLRNMGSIGGNLLQQTRCWYYRGPFDCWMKGGEKCYARKGENEYHSIFTTQPEVSPCVSAHPSDPAAALLALGARVRYRTAAGEAEMPIEQLFALPDAERRSYNTLPHGAIITEIVLPTPSPGARSIYLKAMSRAEWSFALAGIAISLLLSVGHIEQARIGMTGVSPIPIRAHEVEASLAGAEYGKIDHDELATQLTRDAQPLEHNAYKVQVLQALFKDALRQVLGN